MEFNQNEFWGLLLNGMSFTQFIVYAILMAAGALIHFTLDVEHSVKKDPGTPRKFSLRFMVIDNILRGFGVILCIALAIPYYEIFMGTEISPQAAIAFGLTIDVIIKRLAGGTKNISGIRKRREAIIKKINGS